MTFFGRVSVHQVGVIFDSHEIPVFAPSDAIG